MWLRAFVQPGRAAVEIPSAPGSSCGKGYDTRLELATLAWDIVLRTAVVYLVILIELRLAGKRGIGQMTIFDLVLLNLLANAVQNAMVGPDTSLIGGVLAAVVLLERDLAVLRQGIVLGCTTFANTSKYVFITTSANSGNMLSMAGASVFLPFLPVLPMRILLTNFLTDFPAMTIAGDSVDPEPVERPRRWDVRFIGDFVVTCGLASLIFDYLTFGTLLLVVHATQDQFRTGRYLVVSVLVVAGVILALPFSPLKGLLGFTLLPLSLLLVLLGITVLYIITSEVAKRSFYRRVQL